MATAWSAAAAKAVMTAEEQNFRSQTKAAIAAAFVPLASSTPEDFVGVYVDMFSPDYHTKEMPPWDVNPDSRRYVDLIGGKLQVSAFVGSNGYDAYHWGRRFVPGKLGPELAPAGYGWSTTTTDFICNVPEDAPIYADARNGALVFNVTVGTAFGCKCLRWGGLYADKGGKFGAIEVPGAVADNFMLALTDSAAIGGVAFEALDDNLCETLANEMLFRAQGVSAFLAELGKKCLPWQVLPPAMHLGAKKQSNYANDKNFKRNVLKHAPPEFKYFDPKGNEAMAVHIKEVKLPQAEQTHEVRGPRRGPWAVPHLPPVPSPDPAAWPPLPQVCYEPETQCVFVSQMSNSVLVRIPVDGNGFLVDNQDAWMVGELNADGTKGISGMHNVSLSKVHKGCLWISLQ